MLPFSRFQTSCAASGPEMGVMEIALTVLSNLSKADPEAVDWAAYDWLQMSEAGMPYVSLVEGSARDDARFWAETATPAELECYALAACDRLASSNAMFMSRQIKRLAGALFRRMSPTEQAAFKTWINKELTE